MSATTTTRWTITVTKETDTALRAFPGAQGMRKGDISKFIEESVRWRMFDRTVQVIKPRNADRPVERLQAMIGEACEAASADPSLRD